MSKFVKYAVLGFGLVLLGLGIYTGDLATVFRKAATICMECIGIG